MKTLAVTGYKSMELNIFNENDKRIEFIKYAIKQRLIDFLEEGLEWVLTSGQMGIEMWTAEVVLDLKDTYDIQLGVIPPFENFTSRWPETLHQKYELLTLEADFFKPLYKGDYRGPFQFRVRDQWLVEKNDASLIFMDPDYPGSTVYYHSVAEKYDNDPIYYITPLDLQDAFDSMQMIDEPDYYN